MDDPTDRPADDPSVTRIGGFDGGGRAFVLALFGGVGLALGVLAPLLARWATGLPWVPFRGALELISSFDAEWLVWGRPVIGAAAGVAFGVAIILNSPILRITDDEIQVERAGTIVRVIPRHKVDGVHRAGSNTVIENSSGRVLFKGDVEGGADALRAAFLRHGYPWEGPPQKLG